MFVVNIMYSLCYLFMSGVFTIILTKIVESRANRMFKPYFYLSPEIMIILFAAFAVTTVVSAAVPFAMHQKMNIKDLIIKSPD